MAEKNVNTGYGILSYLGILIIIPLLDDDFKKTEYGKFHVNQGLALLIVTVAGWILSTVLAFVLIGFLLYFVVLIVAVVGFFIGIIGAAQGKQNKIPVIGDWKIIK